MINPEQVDLLAQVFMPTLDDSKPLDDAMQAYKEVLHRQNGLATSKQSYVRGYRNAVDAAQLQFNRASLTVDRLRHEIDSPPHDERGQLKVSRLWRRFKIALTDPRQRGWCVKLVKPFLASKEQSIEASLAEREHRQAVYTEVVSGQDGFQNQLVERFKPEENSINGQLVTTSSQIRGIIEDRVFSEKELTTQYVTIIPDRAEQMARKNAEANVLSMIGRFRDCVMFFTFVNSRGGIPGLSQALNLFGAYKEISDLTPEKQEQLMVEYPTFPYPVRNAFANYLAYDLLQQWENQGILTERADPDKIIYEFVTQTNRYLRGRRRSN